MSPRVGIIRLIPLLALLLAACQGGGDSNAPGDRSCVTTSTDGPNGLLAAVHLPGHPFKSIATRSGRWIFTSMSSNGIAVLRRDPGRLCLVHTVAVQGSASGLALTRDDTMLVVANGSGAAFVDVAEAESGAKGAELGSISEPGSPKAIEIAVTTDDRYAFVANENYGTVGAVDLQHVGRGGAPSSALLGEIQVSQGPVGLDSGPVGMALSPDGRSLYVASRIDPVDGSPAHECNGYPPGSLAVVDVTRVGRDPSGALLTRRPAGCGPVRVVVSSSGETAWVAAQEGNQVLAFRTASLTADPGSALLATAPVDRAPTGMALIEDDRVVAVTNSNRFQAPNAPQSFTLLDVGRVLKGQPGLLGTIPVGAFPRELSLESDGRTLLLTNYNSNTVDLFDVRRLPRPSS
ncbi:MAG: lactonase family protein [Candidatus Dormibacteraeota bacterium]|nr:lactonase family protein [Candidatus Dormibacteraeota bacterium]